MIRPMSVPIGDGSHTTDLRPRDRFRVVVLPLDYRPPIEVVNRAVFVAVTGGGSIEKDNGTPDAEWIKDGIRNGDPDGEPSDPDIEWGD